MILCTAWQDVAKLAFFFNTIPICMEIDAKEFYNTKTFHASLPLCFKHGGHFCIKIRVDMEMSGFICQEMGSILTTRAKQWDKNQKPVQKTLNCKVKNIQISISIIFKKSVKI